ncbi:hypothetical protein TCAL_10021 [Tigriopus californicus]|uniref:Uncharacterized protein n=1 Tax=Tigriopus californicus TaxID=6832 RepID=A0A553NX27_TIGCA|nr:tyrosine-protein phosphatase 99A-like isoform X2 [Tigriopus californicus]TRY69985.1 hypothetical protein TCAL_10021 [Tigriopus californicus]
MRSRRLWLSLAWLTLGGGLTITAGPMPLEADSTPPPPPDEPDLVPQLATQAEVSPPPPRDEEIPPDKAALPVPTQLRLLSATQESVRLAWQFTWPGGGSSEPNEASRVLAHDDRANHYFLIIYVHGDDEKFHRVQRDQRECELTGLKTHSLYEIRVKALVGGRSTPPSPPINVSTDVGQPGQPVITNVSCYDTGALSLEWERPSDFDKSVDYYRVFYRPTDQAVFEHVTVPSGTKETSMRYHLRPLVGRKHYVIKICAATRSIYNPNRTWLGEASKEVRVYLPESQCLGPEHGQAGELSIGMVLGAVGALVLLALACVCYVIWKRHLKSAYYEIDDLPRVVVPMGEPQWENEPGLEGAKPGSILVENLEEHVALLHADSDFGFTKEYEEIQTFSAQETQACHLQCSHPDNKCKNRYLNIVAYDHSRVVLSQASGQRKTSDYINANYIDGYRKYNAYIGTQGPLEDTCEAFWRMVWEQNVFVIVMITNLSERGRRKCDMYWPKDDAGCSYGPFEVHLEHEKVMSNYTLRKLKLRHLKLRKKKCASGERDVLQFHYTSWPDHGVPAHPLPVLSFIKKSSESNPPDGGPIIVHCSAGVGRTGTYIAIHALLEQIRDQGQFNAFGFLKHIRKQRNHLVQTEEQYIFIHDAILEALRSGFTEIKSIDITPYIEDIVQNEEMKLQKQLQLITSFEPAEFHCTSAHKSCNVSKNRDSEIVPIESARVVLAPKPGLEGSDYINASWLHGYHRLKEFIITQHPTEDTKHEFWRMLWDHNVQTIVLLSSMEDLTEFPIFWPILDEEFDLETFRVRFIEKATHEGHSTLDFVLSSCQDDYELTVRVILCSGWPHNVKQLTEAFEVLTLVQEWHLEYQNGPMVVLDAMGGTEAATFCALTTLCQQLETEDALDVYQVAKLYHDNRPGVWKSKADILFMYKAMEALIASSHIANPVSSTVNSPAAVAILSPEPVESAPDHDTHHDGEDAIPTNIALGNGDLNGISRHLRSHSDSLANGSVKMTRVGSDSSESSSRRHSLPPVNDVESGLALEACPKPANGIVASLPNDTQHHNHHHHHDNRHRNSSEEDVEDDEDDERNSETAALTASA